MEARVCTALIGQPVLALTCHRSAFAARKSRIDYDDNDGRVDLFDSSEDDVLYVDYEMGYMGHFRSTFKQRVNISIGSVKFNVDYLKYLLTE